MIKKAGLVIGCLLALAVSAVPAQAGVASALAAWWDGLFAPPPVVNKKPPPPAGPPPDLFPPTPTLRFAATNATVKENAGRVFLTVERSSAAGENVSVSYTVVAGGSATAGKDYAAGSGKISFGTREMAAKIGIVILDDKKYEGDETFTVALSDPRGAILDPAASRVLVKIIDDDPKPVVAPPSRLDVRPKSINYGHILVNGESRYREILVFNRGGAPMPMKSLALSGAGAFKVATDECAGKIVAAGKSCSVVVGFKPGRRGTAAARVIISAGGPPAGMTISVNLSGVGYIPVLKEDPIGAMRAFLRGRRRAKAGRAATMLVPPLPAKAATRYDMHDRNYGSIGLGKNFFTLPVIRKRIITVDRYIPCVLEDTINSQIAGFIHCVVESNVFGEEGRLALIPKGTRVVGDYQPLGKAGDTRLNVIWRRFIRPDGSSIMISDGFQAVDIAGRTAIPGVIDNRLWQKYGGAILLTTISAGAALAVPSGNARLADAYKTLADNLGSISTQILEENLDLRPVITVPAGTRLNIIPLVDLWFPNPRIIAPVPQKGKAGRRNSSRTSPAAKQDGGKTTQRP